MHSVKKYNIKKKAATAIKKLMFWGYIFVQMINQVNVEMTNFLLMKIKLLNLSKF